MHVFESQELQCMQGATPEVCVVSKGLKSSDHDCSGQAGGNSKLNLFERSYLT